MARRPQDGAPLEQKKANRQTDGNRQPPPPHRATRPKGSAARAGGAAGGATPADRQGHRDHPKKEIIILIIKIFSSAARHHHPPNTTNPTTNAPAYQHHPSIHRGTARPREQSDRGMSRTAVDRAGRKPQRESTPTTIKKRPRNITCRV